jgi:NADPH-dependent 2,4-dienoyl-CoA reductase/sulfur reductase-like enzyme/nitrite reductase/ring-hydroxylating ferredoxin subunit
MGSDAKPLSGPDFEQGIAFGQLTDGQPLLGHAQGEAVVLVRRGQQVHALGASCTHYGGPIAEGLVVGDTIRCPWHHARFDLRTGAAVGGPALNALPCWQVDQSGETVCVRRKQEAAPVAAGGAGPSSVVIVGAGPAGAACAETLRKEGFGGPITLLGHEPPGPVDRPNLSKDYLAGTAPEEWIPLRGADFYSEQNIDFRPDVLVASVKPAEHTVTLASGAQLKYGALVLATGAEPRRLEVPGADTPQVHLLRTLADSRSIIERAKLSHRAVVVGSSFIGLEAAASLRHRGLEVEVVGMDKLPLARVLGDELGTFVKALHESKGVHFRLGHTITAVGPGKVTLDNGDSLPADLVVVGVGVTPRTALAEAAGLTVDNGIVVDEMLRTSAPDVYAAGDVARAPQGRSGSKVRIEHFVVAERQGQAAARALLGRGKPYRDVPFFWSAHYDVTISYVGHAARWDGLVTQGQLDKRDFAAFYLLGGKVQAVATIGRDSVSLRAEAALEAGDDKALEALIGEG